MNFQSFPHVTVGRCNRRIANAAIMFAMLLCGGSPICHAQQCSCSSSSDGSDGNYDLTGTAAGSTVYFNAANFHGSGVANNVFNFNKIIIPANVTVKFTENVFHGPVYWLAQSDATIAGTLDLTGADANLNQTDPTTRQPSPAGSGGYPGGVGGGSPGFNATPGGGPGGGAVGTSSSAYGGAGYSGSFVGSNDFLVPLIGGSGGGGGFNNSVAFYSGGAGGGGAILLASSTSLTITGTITADGGSAGNCGSAGSGGGILLVSNTIAGGGNIYARGGSVSCAPTHGTAGLIRMEACGSTYDGPADPSPLSSTPIKLFLPTSAPPEIQVTSVNGTPITENPFTFPDITINTASAIPVVITAHQVPIGTIPTLYVFSETGDQQLTCAAGMQGTLTTSTCTINLTFPFGGSRGFVKATWTQ